MPSPRPTDIDKTLRTTLDATCRRLFTLARASESPDELVAWQRELASELTSAELARRVDRATFSRHVRRCRLIDDEIVWRYLHPHAIRIHSWWRQPRPGLVHQADALDLTFKVAQVLADHGVAALITDLTTHLTSGDLLAVVDRERPVIIECKTGSRRAGGRSIPSRQVARYLHQTQHIQRGGSVDDRADRLIMEMSGRHQTSAVGLAGAVRLAQADGQGLVVLPPDEAYWACDLRSGASPDKAFQMIGEQLPNPRAPTLSTTIEMNESPDPRWPPPSYWISDAEAAYAVLDNQIVAARYADLGGLIEAAGPGARLLGDRIERDDDAGRVIWLNIVGEVMAGFTTVASATEMIRHASARASAEAEISDEELDRRRAELSAHPIDHLDLTLQEFRSAADVRDLLLGPPLVVHSS